MGPLRRQEAKRLLRNLHRQGDFDADTWLDRLTDVLNHTPEVVNVCARQLALWNEEIKEQLKFTATPEGSYGAIAEVVLDAAAIYNGESADPGETPIDVVDGWHVGDEVQWYNCYGELSTGTIARIYLDSRSVVIKTPEGGYVDKAMDSLVLPSYEVDGWTVGDAVQWNDPHGILMTGIIDRLNANNHTAVIDLPTGGWSIGVPTGALRSVPSVSPMPIENMLISLQQASAFLRAVASGRTSKSLAETHASRLDIIIDTLRNSGRNTPRAGDDG